MAPQLPRAPLHHLPRDHRKKLVSTYKTQNSWVIFKRTAKNALVIPPMKTRLPVFIRWRKLQPLGCCWRGGPLGSEGGWSRLSRSLPLSHPLFFFRSSSVFYLEPADKKKKKKCVPGWLYFSVLGTASWGQSRPGLRGGREGGPETVPPLCRKGRGVEPPAGVTRAGRRVKSTSEMRTTQEQKLKEIRGVCGGSECYYFGFVFLFEEKYQMRVPLFHTLA